MLVALCQKREASHWWKADCVWGIQCKKEVSKPSLFSMACVRTQCLFCFENLGEPYKVQLHNFAIIYKARNYVELHLKHYKLNNNISCPDPECQKAAIVLHDHLHFMSHAACVHRYDTFRKPARRWVTPTYLISSSYCDQKDCQGGKDLEGSTIGEFTY